ncbi:lysyl-tRNA synthetase-related protein [Candidatus Nitrosoglobus terrae]|uniref:Lysyl-tRNA synthetase-related protein n=1 Tax=Candidatus Nitrosoglobus terrae TaxID=1630141 RepID=A0A1Q2SLG5_9GAMM|nr:elongation factor P--(R)-beta-lysine ligase [Candidatus Nitrosoglobus terrae]BAW79937.1 lysyl-tRNA synthetase-related protein [Candidatus Nitrosoglobus terrae]
MANIGEFQWQPTASRETLVARAQILADIRLFFAERGVLEVETPILSTAAATAPHLHSLTAFYQGPCFPKGQQLFLHTSPEHGMKRLLAAGSGSIYQIARVFRNGEAGQRHNPEFSLLEWYRLGFDHLALMEEVDALLTLLLATSEGEYLTYQEVFFHYLALDVFTVTTCLLGQIAQSYGLQIYTAAGESQRQMYLDFLMTTIVEPQLGHERPCFIYDYPIAEAQLAQIRPATKSSPVPVAERFEVYVKGMELANGYHELRDFSEQCQRFKADLACRKQLGLAEVPIDEYLLAALDQGLPDCAGVALGIDRLLMLRLGSTHIEEVLAFPIDRI